MIIKEKNILSIDNRNFLITDVWMKGNEQSSFEMYEIIGVKIKKSKDKIFELIEQGKIKVIK